MNEKENAVTAQNVVTNGVENAKRDFSNINVWSSEDDKYVLDHYKIGDECEVEVVKMNSSTNTIIEVSTVEEHIKGIIELEELCWNLHNAKPDFNVGDKIRLFIKGISTVQSHIDFTRLTKDTNPWPEYAKAFETSSVHGGTVVAEGDGGFVINLDYNGLPVEAFLRKYNLTSDWCKVVKVICFFPFVLKAANSNLAIDGD